MFIEKKVGCRNVGQIESICNLSGNEQRVFPEMIMGFNPAVRPRVYLRCQGSRFPPITCSGVRMAEHYCIVQLSEILITTCFSEPFTDYFICIVGTVNKGYQYFKSSWWSWYEHAACSKQLGCSDPTWWDDWASKGCTGKVMKHFWGTV